MVELEQGIALSVSEAKQPMVLQPRRVALYIAPTEDSQSNSRSQGILSRRRLLGGAVAVGLAAATIPFIRTGEVIYGQHDEANQSLVSSQAASPEGAFIDAKNILPNGSFNTYDTVANQRLKPKLWRETHHVYEYGALVLGGGPDRGNALRAETFVRDGELLAQNWTTEDSMRVDPLQLYGLKFKYLVHGADAAQVTPRVALKQMETEALLTRPISVISSDQFDVSSGEWQTADFMFAKFDPMTKFIHLDFSLSNTAQNPGPARISFADVHFGRILPGSVPFPGSQKA